MPMRIRIDRKQCAGNARVAEKLYPLDDDGYIATDGFDVAAEDEALALRGAHACPERIIFVEDE
jgi:ferredoxin